MNTELMRAVLDCGIDDLRLMDDANVNFFEVVDRLREEGIACTMKNIMIEVFEIGKQHIVEGVKAAIEDAEADGDEDRVRRLRKLHPATEIGWYWNMQDTHFQMSNVDKYKELVPELLERLEDITSYPIEEVPFL